MKKYLGRMAATSLMAAVAVVPMAGVAAAAPSATPAHASARSFHNDHDRWDHNRWDRDDCRCHHRHHWYSGYHWWNGGGVLSGNIIGIGLL